MLLRAYPAEFRQEYGEQMEDVIAARGARRNAWVRLTGDTLRNAPREHWHILARDLRHSLRMFRKAPGFVLTVLIALGLGVGASVAVFSIIDAVLLRSLPYGDAAHLVYLWTPLPRYASLPRELGPSFADIQAWRERNHSFSALTAFEQAPITLYAGADPIRVGGAFVLGNFFDTLEAKPLLGRVIAVSDDAPGAARVAVIGYELWRADYNQDASIVGRIVRIGRFERRIIGVMPRNFGYPRAADLPLAHSAVRDTEIWLPLALTAQQQTNRMNTATAAIGRLRPGVGLEQAKAEMAGIQTQLDPLNLPEMRGTQSYLVPMIDSIVGPARSLLRLLGFAVFLVLLVACGNVANLLMARAVERIPEIGVRTALGAPRARLVRQLLTESLLLAIAGGALGTALGYGAVRVLASFHPGNLPRLEQANVDGRVLLFAIGLTLGTGVLFGILPALTMARANPAKSLRQGGGRGGGTGHAPVRQALIVGNVAVAVILLTGASLLIRSYLRVQMEDKGFVASALTMHIAMDRSGRSPQQAAALLQATEKRIAALPGVTAVGTTNSLPLADQDGVTTFRVEGYPNRRDQQADWERISGDYLSAIGTRILEGRGLTSADIPAPGDRLPPPVVVSASFARAYFPGGHALGGHLQRGEPSDNWSTIVGIASDVRQLDLEKPVRPAIYEPSWDAGSLAIATAVPPDAMIHAVRQAVRGVDATLALSDIETMRQRTAEATGRRRFQTVMLAGFAAAALLLSLIGLYGLLSYSVRQRMGEIGVRIALGARRGTVTGMFVRQGLRLTLVGLALGVAISGILAGLISGMLFGVRALDPTTFALVPLCMLTTAAVASFVPARRAARIDPVRALGRN